MRKFYLAVKQYDAVVIDIEEVSIVYSSALYTKEYFTIIRDKMSDDGVLALWSFDVGKDFSSAIYHTLKSVFPYTYIRKNDSNITFYASQRALDISPENETEANALKTIITHNNGELNTLDNRVLEKYFNIRSAFGLPTDYDERFNR